jgi:hypothetical protein
MIENERYLVKVSKNFNGTKSLRFTRTRVTISMVYKFLIREKDNI